MCSTMNDVYKTRITNSMVCASVPGGGKVSCVLSSDVLIFFYILSKKLHVGVFF